MKVKYVKYFITNETRVHLFFNLIYIKPLYSRTYALVLSIFVYVIIIMLWLLLIVVVVVLEIVVAIFNITFLFSICNLII